MEPSPSRICPRVNIRLRQCTRNLESKRRKSKLERRKQQKPILHSLLNNASNPCPRLEYPFRAFAALSCSGHALLHLSAATLPNIASRYKTVHSYGYVRTIAWIVLMLDT